LALGYANIDALIEDIKTDIKVAEASLERVPYQACKTDNFWNEK
jgi:hypothetical protein